MEYHEKVKVEKYYVITPWIAKLLTLVLILLTIGFVMMFYVFFRIESAHYPSRILSDLDRIASK
jgi:hypothetical protein